MRKDLLQIAITLAATLAAWPAQAGGIFYQAIPATQSDANCGISSGNGYTTAVDGGNPHKINRVINGITLYALAGSGQSSAADNCTLSALSGSLVNGGGPPANIQADGVVQGVLTDLTFNNGASDNSTQEIVLDPDSLQPGATYDLRVYIGNSYGQNRQVNLAFVGDGEPAAETGFFNEDDARTSAGGFTDANQVYYINYRYTWDGESMPGITITQRSGGTPFVLFALTNQVVPAGAAAGGEGATGGEGLTGGYLNEGSDEVGIASDEFYNSESLNANGRWIKLDKWGTSWQPTTVPSGWGPYTNGNWRECDDCGWTFVSDEPWAWACYHYGRWCKVKTGCGWAWVPGKVWAGSWVSWRQGKDASCSCIGWAPLPPQASCEINVGISTWVDRTCDIGPDCYTFVHIRDFGSDSYYGCGCIYERTRNVIIIRETINITNICYNRRITYCGGPDFRWCNAEIRKHGGKEIAQIYINRFNDPSKIKGGKHSHLEGNQLALLTPHIKGDTNPKHHPKIAETLKADKIDNGWGGVKDPKLEKELKHKIAAESKGKDPKTAKATLPRDVEQKIMTKHGSAGKGRGVATQSLGTAGQTSGGFDQHPGGKGHTNKTATGDVSTGALGTQTTGVGGGKHPGKSSKKSTGAQGELGTTNSSAGNTGVKSYPQGGGKNKHQPKSFDQTGATTNTQGAQGSSGHHKQQLQNHQQFQQHQQQGGGKKNKPSPTIAPGRY